MDLVDECLPVSRIMAEIIGSTRIHKDKMAALCQKGFITAPDILKRLVQDWALPFRQAIVAVEKAMKYSEVEEGEQIFVSALQRSLQEGFSLKVDQKFVPMAQNPKLIVSRRKTIGGTSFQALASNITSLRHFLQVSRRWLTQKRKKHSMANTHLAEMGRNL